MSESEERRTAAAAWQHRDFRFYSGARLIGILGAEAQAVGVAWQIYQITHSALALGYTGLALFLPGLFFTLPAGHVADLFDRRTVLLACYVLQFGATLWLLDMTMHGISNVAWVYGALALIGLGRCFSGPAAAALVPMLVPKEDFVNAVTWGSAIFQIATATGPMFGGILFTISLTGTRWARWNGSAGGVCVHAGVHCAVPGDGGDDPAEGRGGEEGVHVQHDGGGAAVCDAYAAAAGVDFAGSVCGAAGRSDESAADLCGYGAACGARMGWACCARCRALER